MTNRNEFLEALMKALVERTRDLHKHRCEKDGTIWEHVSPPFDASEAEYRQAHQCPKCGTEQRDKYQYRQKEAA